MGPVVLLQPTWSSEIATGARELLVDLEPGEADVAMRDVSACREAYPNHYVKVVAYDSSLGRQTSMLSFIVNRPDEEPGFRLERQDKAKAGDRGFDERAVGVEGQRPAGCLIIAAGERAHLRAHRGEDDETAERG